jgi:hypothetical protein
VGEEPIRVLGERRVIEPTRVHAQIGDTGSRALAPVRRDPAGLCCGMDDALLQLGQLQHALG